MASSKTRTCRVDPNRVRPKTVRGYEIQEVIGKGSFGIVHRVKNGDQELAMKVMDLRELTDKDVEHCLQEGEMMRRFVHPNLVILHKSFQQDQKLYIVMEYCAGGSLKDHLARLERDLEETEVVSFMMHVCKALQFLHSKGFIHRDVKTGNIFLTKDQKLLKLGDMALTREYKENFSMTHVPGTPVYMSPEVIDCKRYDQKADIWSLGCCFYEMCHRRGIFFVASSLETLQQMIKMEQTRKNTIRQHVCDEMDQLFKSMIECDSQHRPAIDEVLTCLETHTHDSPTRSPVTAASSTYSTASTASAASSEALSVKSSATLSANSSSSSSSRFPHKTSARRSPSNEPGATGGGSLRGSRLEMVREEPREKTSDYETDTEQSKYGGPKYVAAEVDVWMTEDEYDWYQKAMQLQKDICKKVDQTTMKKIKDELYNTRDEEDEKQFLKKIQQFMDEGIFQRCRKDLKALWEYKAELLQKFKLAS